uniref:Uncharacterized protein n=1 Tax=Oryza glumipatula TaxID=40148 RepID=A0A0E0BNS2_9ORYZ
MLPEAIPSMHGNMAKGHKPHSASALMNGFKWIHVKKYYIGGKIYKNRPCRSSFGRQTDMAHGVVTVLYFTTSLDSPHKTGHLVQGTQTSTSSTRMKVEQIYN